ncbi:hypothetical protein A6E15_01225 [Natrinema saccharevitans]|uniref:Uncharacterized protein n=1 Tax=Natrinema saccharevitans TaxID=301967 RepID=A0A1S8AT16_9EURY|nr:hypothetical protein [Natrinema saccharevitans]OLZ39687.1 hypothetical protein A6E15_01225 [Natrinema saccharevitans]
MTAHHDDDATTDESIDELPGLEDPEELADAASGLAAASDALGGGTLPVLGGGLLLAAAVRSLAANRRRAVPLAVAGGALAGYGLRRRRSSAEGGDVPDVEEGTEGKDVSDAAGAAAESVDSGRESEIEGDGEIADPGMDDPADSGSRIEFTDEPDEDPSRSGPDLGSDEGEPRRETGTDEVEVDVSDTAMADETSEATGPDPTQAQPTQTADTEPEASPAEDDSEMKVEPPEDDDSDAETADSEATADDESDDEESDGGR